MRMKKRSPSPVLFQPSGLRLLTSSRSSSATSMPFMPVPSLDRPRASQLDMVLAASTNVTLLSPATLGAASGTLSGMHPAMNHSIDTGLEYRNHLIRPLNVESSGLLYLAEA
jgi:hypothetical protein